MLYVSEIVAYLQCRWCQTQVVRWSHTVCRLTNYFPQLVVYPPAVAGMLYDRPEKQFIQRENFIALKNVDNISKNRTLH